MTQPNPFEDYLNNVIGPDQEASIDPTCENVHPIVDEYMGLLTEDLMKLDKEDMGEALKKRLSPNELQMIECMTAEIMMIFDAQISDAEDDALDLMISSGTCDDELEDLDNKAKMAEGFDAPRKNFPEDEFEGEYEDDDDEDGTPLLIPMYGLESLIRRALSIGYLTMPDIASHL
jgi:hypothetical protein